METQKRNVWIPIVIVVVLIAILGGLVFWQSNKQAAARPTVKIGIVTDLTGGASYWGESTQVGAAIAKKELEAEGYKPEFIFEDYKLDAQKALSSAQKLVNIDNVSGMYAEFNPAAISAGSFLKGKSLLYTYDAAVTSPLAGNSLAFKTYLDYQAGCKAVAQKFQTEGVTKVGFLKVNLEFGELCQAGITEVFGTNLDSEAYTLGDTDFKTQILKFKTAGVGAVMNVGFEGDTLNTLKAMKEQSLKVSYGTVDDTITASVKTQYPTELKGAWTFGFAQVDPSFSAKIKQETTKTLSTEFGAAIAYTHLKQMVKALDKCNNDTTCAATEMAKSVSDSTIGFNKFIDRIADLDMTVKQY